MSFSLNYVIFVWVYTIIQYTIYIYIYVVCLLLSKSNKIQYPFALLSF